MIIKKIKYRIKWFFGDLWSTGKTPDFSAQHGQIRVLCFHGICQDDKAFINGRFMRESQFSQLIEAMSRTTHFLSIQDFLSDNFQSNKLNVLLTFDDGYKNNVDLALPILEEYNAPAVFFITNEHDILLMDAFDIYRNSFGEPGSPNQNELTTGNKELVNEQRNKLKELIKNQRENYSVYSDLMQNEDLEVLKEHPLSALGNHTANHLDLTKLRKDEISSELKPVSERIQSPNLVDIIALPYGRYTNQTISDIKSLYPNAHIFALDKHQDDDDVIERLTVNPFISLNNQLRAIKNGYY